MKTTYTIEIQSTPLDEISPEILDAFSEALFRDRRLLGAAPSASIVTRTLSFRASMDPKTARDGMGTAVAIAMDAFVKAAAQAGVKPSYEFSEITLVRDPDDAERARDELVGTPEVASILGVSRERVRQLAETPGHFPSPVATIRDTRVWRWGDIADWITVGGRRKSGRPAKQPAKPDKPPLAHRVRRRTKAA